MKANLTMALVLAASALLTACGGGDDAPPARVAVADTTAAANSTTTAAVVGKPFTFEGGVPELGTTGTTTVAFTSTGTTPDFTIASAEGTATGTTEFGSCNFRVRTSTYPSTHPLGVGKAVLIALCSLTANTAGLPADGTVVTRTMTFQLGARRSLTITVSLSVNSDGVVVINGVTFAITPTGPVTGGGS